MRQLNALAVSADAPDHIAIARLRRDIEKLRTADPASGWMAVSALESALFNADATLHAVAQAIRLGPQRQAIALNCSLSLTRAGFYAEALELLCNTASLMRGDAEVWTRFADLAYFLGRFSEFRQAFAHSQNLAQTQRPYPPVVDSIEELLGRSGHSESELSAVILAVLRVLADEKVRDGGINFQYLTEIAGYHERIAVSFDLPLEITEILRIEQHVFDRLAELALPIEADDIVSVRLRQLPTERGTNGHLSETTA